MALNIASKIFDVNSGILHDLSRTIPIFLNDLSIRFI